MTDIGLDDSDEWNDPEPRSVSVTAQNVVGVSTLLLLGIVSAIVMIDVSLLLAPMIGADPIAIAVLFFFMYVFVDSRIDFAEWVYFRSIDAAEKLRDIVSR